MEDDFRTKIKDIEEKNYGLEDLVALTRAEVIDLEEKNSSLTNDIDQLTIIHKDLQNRLISTEQKLREITSTCVDNDRQIQFHKQEEKKVKVEFEKVKQNEANLRSEIEEMTKVILSHKQKSNELLREKQLALEDAEDKLRAFEAEKVATKEMFIDIKSNMERQQIEHSQILKRKDQAILDKTNINKGIERRVHDIATSLERTTSVLKEKDSEIHDLRVRLQLDSDEINDLKMERDEVQKNFNDKLNSLKQLSEKLSEQKKTIDILNSKNSELLKEISDSKEKSEEYLNQLQVEARKAQKETADMENIFVDERRRNEEIHTNLKNELNTLEEKCKAIQDSCKTKVAAAVKEEKLLLERAKSEEHQRILGLNEKISQLQKIIENNQRSIVEKDEQISKLYEERINVDQQKCQETEMRERRIQDLGNECKASEQKLKNLVDKLKVAKDDSISLQKRVIEIENERDQLLGLISETKTEITSLNNELQLSKDHAVNLQKSLSLQEEKVHSIETEKEDQKRHFEEELRIYEERHVSVLAEMQKVHIELSSTASKLSECESERISISNNARALVKSLEEELMSSRVYSKDLQKNYVDNIDALKRDVSELEKCLKAKSEEMQSNHGRLNKQLLEARHSCDEITIENKKNILEIEQKNREISTLRRELDGAEERERELQKHYLQHIHTNNLSKQLHVHTCIDKHNLKEEGKHGLSRNMANDENKSHHSKTNAVFSQPLSDYNHYNNDNVKCEIFHGEAGDMITQTRQFLEQRRGSILCKNQEDSSEVILPKLPDDE